MRILFFSNIRLFVKLLYLFEVHNNFINVVTHHKSAACDTTGSQPNFEESLALYGKRILINSNSKIFL